MEVQKKRGSLVVHFSCCRLLHSFLLNLFLEPEDGVCMFLRNVGGLYQLQGVTTEKIVSFVSTALRTSASASHIYISRRTGHPLASLTSSDRFTSTSVLSEDAVEWVAPLLRIGGILSLNLDPENSCPN
jgi:hypothetical protein